MSVVSVIAVAGRCEIIKVCTKACLCWLEFKYASSLLGKGSILWTLGLWLSSRGQIRLAIGGGHNMLRNQGAGKMDGRMDRRMDRRMDGCSLLGDHLKPGSCWQSQRAWGRSDPRGKGWAAAAPRGAGQWVTPLRSWWTKPLELNSTWVQGWVWILSETYIKESKSWYLYPRKENKPAEALHNSRNWGTKWPLGVKKCCFCLLGRGKAATLEQWCILGFFKSMAMFRIAAAVTSMNSQACKRLVVFYYSFNTLWNNPTLHLSMLWRGKMHEKWPWIALK